MQIVNPLLVNPKCLGISYTESWNAWCHARSAIPLWLSGTPSPINSPKIDLPSEGSQNTVFSFVLWHIPTFLVATWGWVVFLMKSSHPLCSDTDLSDLLLWDLPPTTSDKQCLQPPKTKDFENGKKWVHTFAGPFWSFFFEGSVKAR